MYIFDKRYRYIFPMSFHLITNGIYTGLAIVGVMTIFHKAGRFLKRYESEKEDHFKKAFDSTVSETIDDIHSCVESVSVITNGLTKASSVAIDLATGNKVILKKRGQFVVVEQSKAHKKQLEEMSAKVKKYEAQLKKIRGKRRGDDEEEDEISSISGGSGSEKEEIESKSASYALDGKK